MDPLSPPVAQFLFHGAARKIQPDLVEESTTPVGPWPGRPNHHRGGVGHISEALFTLAQPLFSLMPLGNIGEHANPPVHLVVLHPGGDVHRMNPSQANSAVIYL